MPHDSRSEAKDIGKIPAGSPQCRRQMQVG